MRIGLLVWDDPGVAGFACWNVGLPPLSAAAYRRRPPTRVAGPPRRTRRAVRSPAVRPPAARIARSPRAQRPVEFDEELRALAGHVRPAHLDRQLVAGRRPCPRGGAPAGRAPGRAAALRGSAGGSARASRATARRGSRSAGRGSRTGSRARDRRPGGPGTVRPTGGPAPGGAARRPALRRRSRKTTGAPGAMPRVSATASLAGSRRAVSSSVRGSQAAQLHLLREAERGGQVAHDARRRDERAPAAGPLQALLAGQVGEGPAHRDEAAAVALGELPLGRQPVPDRPLARLDPGAQVDVDLVVQRDRSGLELETCQPGSSQGPPLEVAHKVICNRRRRCQSPRHPGGDTGRSFGGFRAASGRHPVDGPDGRDRVQSGP